MEVLFRPHQKLIFSEVSVIVLEHCVSSPFNLEITEGGEVLWVSSHLKYWVCGMERSYDLFEGFLLYHLFHG